MKKAGIDEKGELLSESELGTKPVSKLFPKYFLPAIVASLLPCIWVMLDGAFLGAGVGAAALAAISILFPYFALLRAVSNLIGNGGASICAVELGKGNIGKARKVLAQSVLYCFALTVSISIISLLFMPSILHALGGRGEVAALAAPYLKLYLISFPFMTTGFTIYYFVRTDAAPVLGSAVMFILPVIATFAEYLLIFKYKAGFIASAIAFVISYAPCCLFILRFLLGKSQLRLQKSDFKLDIEQINEINKVGFASCAIQLTGCVVTIIVNNVIIAFGAGIYEIAAFGIIKTYIYYVAVILAYSFGIGIQPIVSYNFGSGQYNRVKEVLKYGCVYGIIIMLILVGLCYIFIDQLTTLFTVGDPLFFAATKIVIMKYLWGIVFGTVTLVGTYFYQAIESPAKSTFLALSRSFLFELPLLFITAKLFGLDGIWYSFPAAEVISCIITLFMMKKEALLNKSWENESESSS